MKKKLPFRIVIVDTFHHILNNFANDLNNTHKSQYTTRIPYATWRKLKKPFCKLTISTSKNPDDYINLKFEYINAPALELTFNIHDNGFGTWLYDHFDTNPREDDNKNVDDNDMTQYEVNSITTTSSTAVDSNTTIPYSTNIWTTTTIPYSTTNYTTTVTPEDINKLIDNKLNERKEPTNKMEKTNDFLTFDFGPVNDNQFAASPYGIAVYAPETDTWLTYNADTNEVVDAKIFHFDVKGFFYKIPTPISNIKTGDIIIHMGTPMFVRAVNTDNTVTAVNYHDASVTTILPKKSPFGFNFITKVISLMSFDKMTADKDNPFGNMLPFFMMQDGKFDPMMLLFMNGGNMENMNPLLLYLMMDKKNNNKDILPLMLMMSGGTFNFN